MQISTVVTPAMTYQTVWKCHRNNLYIDIGKGYKNSLVMLLLPVGWNTHKTVIGSSYLSCVSCKTLHVSLIAAMASPNKQPPRGFPNFIISFPAAGLVLGGQDEARRAVRSRWRILCQGWTTKHGRRKKNLKREVGRRSRSGIIILQYQ